MEECLSAALSGLRVVAVTTNVPGPLAASRLAALGAAVVKVEPPRGDPLQTAAPQWYARLHERIEILQLDISSEPGAAMLRERVLAADVLLTAMRAKALERAGLVWETLVHANRQLVAVAIVGESAPHRDRAGHDLTYQARAGLLEPPAMPRTLVGDLACAERTVSAVLAALHARERDGLGRYVEIAIVDAAEDFAAPLRYGLTASTGALGGALPTYRLYPAGRGWVAVAALEAHFAARLSQMLEIETLDATAIGAALSRRTAQEWERLAQAHDVPLAEVRDRKEN